MIITAPVTDYIPASILTTESDILRRGPTNPERLARPASMSYLAGYPAGAYPVWRTLAGVDNNYFKTHGGLLWPDWSPLALSDTGIVIGNGTRNSSGDEVFTGIGFLPSLMIFLATDDTPGYKNWSIGFDNIVYKMCLQSYDENAATKVETSFSIYIKRTGSHYLNGKILGFGADGFTIQWVLLGACAIDYIYLALP